jgi:hypothetical protein
VDQFVGARFLYETYLKCWHLSFLTPFRVVAKSSLLESSLEMISPPPSPTKATNETAERLPKSIRALKDSRKLQHHPRTLIICLDGTGDRFDNDNSNVVHFVSCLKKHEPEKQVTYYQSGIGTYDQGGLQNGIGAAMDMAVGSGVGTFMSFW